jgi:circadian clock protein KaiC
MVRSKSYFINQGMKKKIQIIESGIPLVDKYWGGFYRGGTYFLIGRHKSGKTLLGIQYAMECVKQKELCLLFTTMRPKDLMIHAASIDFDLQQCMDQNLIVVIRVSPPENIPDEKKDEHLAEYFEDIASLVQQYHPNRIIFDELTPFIEFKNLNLLKSIFIKTVETIEESNIVSLFIVGEPATSQSKNIVDVLSSSCTGVVYLEKEEEDFRIKRGIMTIVPNIGHIEGKYSANYYLEPYKGITIAQKSLEDNISIKHPKVSGYKNLAEIELPEAAALIFNLYTIDEFKLFLNNQVAVYKSTGQKFSVISFHLNPGPDSRSLLTLNQLKNTVRLSIDRKDKFCVMNNKVIVLVLKDDKENLNVMAKVKNNLPSNDPDEKNEMLKDIFVYTVTVDDTINSADDIIKKLMVEESSDTNLFFY